jgi:hypothetical protein
LTFSFLEVAVGAFLFDGSFVVDFAVGLVDVGLPLVGILDLKRSFNLLIPDNIPNIPGLDPPSSSLLVFLVAVRDAPTIFDSPLSIAVCIFLRASGDILSIDTR